MLPFYMVDVFAREKYSGNQLAVVRGKEKLDSETMQKIAREINFSETTFIPLNSPEEDSWEVRIFTPEEEVPFAGHPTLGTAYVLREKIIKKPMERLELKTKAGSIPVSFEGDMVWMRQNPPQFGPCYNGEELAPVLGLTPEDIDSRYPAQEVSTGLPFVIIPLKGLSALKQARIDRERYFKFISGKNAKSLVVFAPEGYSGETDMSVRVFAEYYGVPEDPATGSANGCLNGYLLQHRYGGEEEVDIKVDQGWEVGRPSLLLLQGQEIGSQKEIRVGGRVISTGSGYLE